MSRSGGYKCYNTRCSSCLGKTLCTEPGDTALSCQDRVIENGGVEGYKDLVKQLFKFDGAMGPCDEIGCPNLCGPGVDCVIYRAATAINDLLSRTEAAEAAQETLQKAMAEYKDRAEKAEKCIAEIQSARDNTRPAYVVDQILKDWRGQKEE